MGLLKSPKFYKNILVLGKYNNKKGEKMKQESENAPMGAEIPETIEKDVDKAEHMAYAEDPFAIMIKNAEKIGQPQLVESLKKQSESATVKAGHQYQIEQERSKEQFVSVAELFGKFIQGGSPGENSIFGIYLKEKVEGSIAELTPGVPENLSSKARDQIAQLVGAGEFHPEPPDSHAGYKYKLFAADTQIPGLTRRVTIDKVFTSPRPDNIFYEFYLYEKK